MSHTHHHHRHGSVFAGRIMVAVACVLVLATNACIFKVASAPMFAAGTATKVQLVIALVWLFAGAYAMCTRKAWGRFLVLIIVYLETFALFVSGIVAFNSIEIVPAGLVRAFFLGSAVYLYVSLVLTHSKHVRRLTSRAWE